MTVYFFIPLLHYEYDMDMTRHVTYQVRHMDSSLYLCIPYHRMIVLLILLPPSIPLWDPLLVPISYNYSCSLIAIGYRLISTPSAVLSIFRFIPIGRYTYAVVIAYAFRYVSPPMYFTI